MNFVKALGILVLASMTLAACSDVNPVVSTLRTTNPTTSPGTTDSVSSNGSYIRIDQPASGILTASGNGMVMTLNVSKGDSTPSNTSSDQYKLYLDDSDQ